LLIAELEGKSGTDTELASALGISVSVVKKTWLSIYQRAGCLLPEPILTNTSLYDGAGKPEGERGKEKRRMLLAYVRDHLEELRPYSCKLANPSAMAR
jgi:hypothetical protein